MTTQKKYIILGLHFGHGAGAAIISNGRIIADVSEERFNHVKHSSDLPFASIKFCLKQVGISVHEIDEIAIAGLAVGDQIETIFGQKIAIPEKPAENFKEKIYSAGKKIVRGLFFGNRPSTGIKTPLYCREFFLDKLPKVTFVEHHLAHAAAAYFTSNDDRKMIIATMDGSGDGKSSCIWKGEDGKISPLAKYDYKSSLGWFYSNVTEAIGWWHGDGEGKTMGLAPYGDLTKVQGVLDGFYPEFKNGELVKAYNFPETKEFKLLGSIHWHSDDAQRIEKIVKKYGKENVAAEAQRILEEQTMEFVLPWLEKENTKVLATSGGIFLNVKLNQRIWESGKVELHHPYPNPGDAGLPLGAALYAAKEKGTLKSPVANHLYWGPEYTNEEIEKILAGRGLHYLKSDDAPLKAARLLSEDKIVGWFQGRMESGPRALGNRSILMSPKKAENKDIINARVKFREAFRPFCPSLIDEAKEKYLVKPRSERFMVTSFDCTKERKAELPAVVHVDGTLRPQTVAKEDNPRYWRLISEFGKITGTPVVLNTSMNIMGEPIACSPREAIRCFFDSGMDVLVLGDFILEKSAAL
ncbi:MAG: carbamoyltransferase C-terminal domain-containing protein [Patescibacteria group bacterium]